MMLNFTIERTLHFVIQGQHQTGHVRIGPIEEHHPGRWDCHCSISFVSPEPSRIPGVDPLDALNRCLQFVGRLLRGSEKDGLVLWWQAPGDHGGFD
jgi:hypothetical protein